MGRRGRRKAEPTDDWQELLPLFEWSEQRAYEELRPLVLFGASVAERAKETGTPERTTYRRVERFEKDGMLSLFGTDSTTARAGAGDPIARRRCWASTRASATIHKTCAAPSSRPASSASSILSGMPGS